MQLRSGIAVAVVATPIQPLAQEHPYAADVPIKKREKKKVHLFLPTKKDPRMTQYTQLKRQGGSNTTFPFIWSECD